MDIINFFIKYKLLNIKIKQKSTIFIIKEIFNILNKYFEKINNIIYKFDIIYINKYNHIYTPKLLSLNQIIPNIQHYIYNNSNIMIIYNYIILGHKLKVIFILKNKTINNNEYNNYCKNILLCFFLLKKLFPTCNCSKILYIYIYHTDLLKLYPKKNIMINKENINTGFTLNNCSLYSEIIIFRKEEWFKVFIHELIHNLNIDFSSMDNYSLNILIINLFSLNIKDIHLYEAYCEFWARFINICLFSFLNINNNTKKNNTKKHITKIKSFNKFIKTFEFYINLEINFSFLQVIKYLNFINLQYSNINNNKYIENVPIFSYYIITLILLYNYENFGIWCINNNGFKQFIVFKKTINNQIKFYEFIKKEYNTIKFLNIIERFNTFFININNIKHLNNNFKKYLINNLRMSIM